jgi:hypothetical protein
MINFWDIEFDDELDLEVDELVEGLLKLGFKRKNKDIFIKEIINHNGDKVDDGLIYYLTEQLLIYYPEQNNGITIKNVGNDIEKIDEFIRKNIL